MSLGAFPRNITPGQILTIIRRLRGLGDYIQSGTDADDPATRTARIRADMRALLLGIEPDVPLGALDPFLDYVAAKLASEPAATAHPQDSAGAGTP